MSPVVASRVQYRVGHGGFHATTVKKSGSKGRSLTYVYDVGAKPAKALLLNQIKVFVDELISEGIVCVDYVVLSHIDEDHVNGLVELLYELKGSQIKVSAVVLPWLSPVQKLIAQQRNNLRQNGVAVGQLAGSDEDADHFLRDSGVEKVVRILANEDDYPVSGGASVMQRQGTNLANPVSNSWQLVPIRMGLPDSVQAEFLDELDALLWRHAPGLDARDLKDHQEILRFHRKHVRVAMQKVAHRLGVAPKDISNWSSLALLHGSTQTAGCTVSPLPSGSLEMGCQHFWLHTGDLPLCVATVWTEFSNELAKVSAFRSACVLVAPHHGSDNSHEASLYTTTKPGTVVLTTGRVLTGTNRGSRSYGLKTQSAEAAGLAAGASIIDLHN